MSFSKEVKINQKRPKYQINHQIGGNEQFSKNEVISTMFNHFVSFMLNLDFFFNIYDQKIFHLIYWLNIELLFEFKNVFFLSHSLCPIFLRISNEHFKCAHLQKLATVFFIGNL